MAFVLYEIVYFFSPLERWWSLYIPGISYSFLTVILMILIAAKGLLKKETQHNPLKSTPIALMILLALLIWVVSFYAIDPSYNKYIASNYTKLTVTICLAYILSTHIRALKSYLIGLSFGATYLALLIQQKGRDIFGRVEGVGTVDSPDANGSATLLVPAFIAVGYLFISERNKLVKAIYLISGAIILNGLVLLNSRGSFLALAIGCILFFIIVLRTPHREKFDNFKLLFIASLVVIISITQIADSGFWKRIETIKTTEFDSEQESGSTRFLFWKSAVELSIDYPMGQGAGAFNYFSPDYIPYYVDTGASRNRSVHSTWFEVLTEYGYLGLGLFSTIIFLSFKKPILTITKFRNCSSRENYLIAGTILCMLAAYLISASFMNRFKADVLYWLILYSAVFGTTKDFASKKSINLS